ncbi:hypothetical protein D915_007395 [Fasciola hepatica]|uniref:Uncharacterized protein n=1 Tax=Fasciola hepatica TaxID=6192 RepID=A0A4E0RYT3_FASHE|nr:hypothetical protein D915_007395 [Fasciola hepatica]
MSLLKPLNLTHSSSQCPTLASMKQSDLFFVKWLCKIATAVYLSAPTWDTRLSDVDLFRVFHVNSNKWDYDTRKANVSLNNRSRILD